MLNRFTFVRKFAAAVIAGALSTALLTVSAQSSEAQTLFFTFSGTDTATFTADSSPSTMANYRGISSDFVLYPQTFGLDGISYSSEVIFEIGQIIVFNTGSDLTSRYFGFTTSFIAGSSFVTGNYTDGIENLSISASPVVSGVPELSTWAMMLLGFSGLGFLTYRKSRTGDAGASMVAA